MEKVTRFADGQNIQPDSLSASEAGIGMLNDMQEKLYLAGNELQRVENESTIPPSDANIAKGDAYFDAGKRIRKVLLIARRLLPPMLANLPIFETHKRK